MRIEKVSGDVFSEINLDDFNRQQKVTRRYIRNNGSYILEEQHWLMDWSLDKKRKVAHDLMSSDNISYLALENNRIVGFVSLAQKLISERMVLDMIQVDKDFRGQGIGRMLWEKAVEEAHIRGARELYISACPAEETIAFYLSMGAEITDDPIISISNEEPYDLQLVCPIA